MPEISELHPLQVETDSDRRKRLAYEHAKIRDIGIAAIGQTATSAFVEAGFGMGYSPDLDFTIDEKMFDHLTEGVDPIYWQNFAGAVSYEHAQFIKNQAQMRMG